MDQVCPFFWGRRFNRDRLTDKQKDFIEEGWPVEIIHYPDEIEGITIAS